MRSSKHPASVSKSLKEMSTRNLVRFLRDINGSYMITNLRMNFRRDSRSLKINCVEAKELSLTRKTRAQPWKYYIHHLFYLASTFFLTFFLLLWQVRNYSLLELSQSDWKKRGKKKKRTSILARVRWVFQSRV